jgi:hypothetical protein
LQELKAMAPTAKATTNTKPVAPRKAPAKAAKASAAAKRAPVATPAGLKLGKDALRVEVEKLGRVNTTVRAKGKEANRAAKLPRASRQARSVGPGDAAAARTLVPEPARLDEAAEAILEKLEEDLGDF